MDILILCGGFTVLCLMGMPVAYALGLAAILAAIYIDLPLEAIMLQTSTGMSGFSLLAIPFFILAGELMETGGISQRLVTLARVLVGHIRGGLGNVVIVAMVFFSGISGAMSSELTI